MSTVYMSDSSRRFPEASHGDMEKKWEESLGKPKGAVCDRCGNKSSDGRLVKGLCWNCRNDPLWICRVEPSVDIEKRTVDNIMEHDANGD